jgi:AraC-like DNA-binding protein
LDEICEVSGYASRSSLFRQFKAITGHTPIGWMASVEDSNEENVDEDEIVGNDENVEDEESDDNA